MKIKEYFDSQTIELYAEYLNREYTEISTKEDSLTEINYFKIIEDMTNFEPSIENINQGFLVSVITASINQMKNEEVKLTGELYYLALTYLSLSKATQKAGKGVAKVKIGELEEEYFAELNGWDKWISYYFDLTNEDGKRIGYRGV